MSGVVWEGSDVCRCEVQRGMTVMQGFILVERGYGAGERTIERRGVCRECNWCAGGIKWGTGRVVGTVLVGSGVVLIDLAEMREVCVYSTNSRSSGV